jgi:hypothetical protein
MFLKVIHKIEIEEMLLNSSSEISVTLKPKLNKGTTKKRCKDQSP